MRIKEKAKERLLLQESICSFLKIRKVPIIIFTGIVVIFGILFYLYDIPFDAIIYGCELSFVWCAVCLFIDFYKYYKRHKLLHINREQFLDDAEQLPKHMDIIEYDYQELAKELYQAKQELILRIELQKKSCLIIMACGFIRSKHRLLHWIFYYRIPNRCYISSMRKR